MKSLTIVFAFLLLFSGVAIAQTDWNSSPYNWKNNEMKWESNSINWNNNPMNWKNNSMNQNSDRIIRDNQGKAKGYAVPREDGGTNYYDFDGNRRGYKSGEKASGW